MKKLSIFIILFAVSFDLCFAQQRTIERLYLSTDRTAYVAGERMWLSLFCFDMSDKNLCLSNLSSVAYIELRQDASLVLSAKLRIEKGRSSGVLSIPATLATGNYRLVAYTKQMLNEEKWACFDKIIPIYNTLSIDRVAENVLIKEDQEWPDGLPAKSNSNCVEVKFGTNRSVLPKNSSHPVILKNVGEEALTLSVSIARTDIQASEEHSIEDFLSCDRPEPADIRFYNRYTPEYEGEIIGGKIKNMAEIFPKDQEVFLSAVGPRLNIYATPVDAVAGEFTFYTNSLFGNREVALSYPSTNNEVSFELYDPFVKPPVQPVPPLYLDARTKVFLTQRSVEMQVNHRFGLDTLYDRTTEIDHPFLYTNNPVVYMLDNYTRFPAMADITVEFITQLRFRRTNNQPVLQILLGAESGFTYAENSLAVVDGIALFDHERLLLYDPLKVKRVSIYQNRYRIGNNIFNGIAKFDTYSGNYPGLTLGKNSLIVDFQGVQYPCRFLGNHMWIDKENLPDVRTLLYWDPQIDLKSGENHEVMLTTSAIPGNYAVVLEGVTAGGQAIYHRSLFSVE